MIDRCKRRRVAAVRRATFFIPISRILPPDEEESIGIENAKQSLGTDARSRLEFIVRHRKSDDPDMPL
jgi:hypothetical protein